MKLSLSVRNVLVLATGLASAVVSQSAYAESLNLNFGVYSSSEPSSIVLTYRPVLNELEARMSEKLGQDVQIRLKIANNFDQSITDLKNNKVDFSRFTPSSYFEAEKLDEGIAILAMETKQSEQEIAEIITTNPWISRANLHSTIFAALQQSLHEVDTEETLQELNIDGFLSGTDTDFTAIRQAMEFNFQLFEKPLSNEELLAKQSSETRDRQAIEAASGILAEQATTVDTPTLGAALPETNGVLTAAQQLNADRAASAMATQLVNIPRKKPAVQTTANVRVNPSDIASDDNNITINIALPRHLVKPDNTSGAPQNITINLSFPQDAE